MGRGSERVEEGVSQGIGAPAQSQDRRSFGLSAGISGTDGIMRKMLLVMRVQGDAQISSVKV